MAAPEDDFRWPVRVYYEDTDSAGIVYHASYLRFMERARTEWLRSIGFHQRRLREEQRVLFAVSRLSVEYLEPARFDDLLVVGVRILRHGRASMHLAQHVSGDGGAGIPGDPGVSEGAPHAVGRCVCRADVRIACLHAETLRPCAIPPPIRSELKGDR